MQLKDIQNKHKEWVALNFGHRVPNINSMALSRGMTMVSIASDISRSILKADQGIRGSVDSHYRRARMMTMELAKLCGCKVGHVDKVPLTEWIKEIPETANKGGCTYEMRISHCVFGMVEEIGELISARYSGDTEGIHDAIGDICMYLIDLCNVLEVDLAEIIERTAEHVHQRDWNANPETGEVSV